MSILWWFPRLRDVGEHAADGTCGLFGVVVVVGTQPGFSKAWLAVIVLAVQASYRPNDGQFVDVGEIVDLRVAVTANGPTGFRAVVAVVA